MVDENGRVLDGKYTDANGNTYTYESILNIPSLGIEYPVLSDTNDELLKISINKNHIPRYSLTKIFPPR